MRGSPLVIGVALTIILAACGSGGPSQADLVAELTRSGVDAPVETCLVSQVAAVDRLDVLVGETDLDPDSVGVLTAARDHCAPPLRDDVAAFSIEDTSSDDYYADFDSSLDSQGRGAGVATDDPFLVTEESEQTQAAIDEIVSMGYDTTVASCVVDIVEAEGDGEVPGADPELELLAFNACEG